MLKSNENNVLSFLRKHVTNNSSVTMYDFHRRGSYGYDKYDEMTDKMVVIIKKLHERGFILGENLDNKNFKVTAITDKTIQYQLENPPEFE